MCMSFDGLRRLSISIYISEPWKMTSHRKISSKTISWSFLTIHMGTIGMLSCDCNGSPGCIGITMLSGQVWSLQPNHVPPIMSLCCERLHQNPYLGSSKSGIPGKASWCQWSLSIQVNGFWIGALVATRLVMQNVTLLGSRWSFAMDGLGTSNVPPISLKKEKEVTLSPLGAQDLSHALVGVSLLFTQPHKRLQQSVIILSCDQTISADRIMSQ